MDMVRSMLSYFSLPLSLWMESLKIVMYLLNWVPNKAIPETPFEIWTKRKAPAFMGIPNRSKNL